MMFPQSANPKWTCSTAASVLSGVEEPTAHERRLGQRLKCVRNRSLPGAQGVLLERVTSTSTCPEGQVKARLTGCGLDLIRRARRWAMRPGENQVTLNFSPGLRRAPLANSVAETSLRPFSLTLCMRITVLPPHTTNKPFFSWNRVPGAASVGPKS